MLKFLEITTDDGDNNAIMTIDDDNDAYQGSRMVLINKFKLKLIDLCGYYMSFEKVQINAKTLKREFLAISRVYMYDLL